MYSKHQTCHFRKRATSVPAEGPVYGLDFARHFRALRAQKWRARGSRTSGPELRPSRSGSQFSLPGRPIGDPPGSDRECREAAPAGKEGEPPQPAILSTCLHLTIPIHMYLSF